MKKRPRTFLVVFSLLLLVVVLLTGPDADAATPNKQPVVGYAHTMTCVSGNKPAQVHYVITNQSSRTRTIVVWQYGLTAGSSEDLKGFAPFINPVRSGLTATALPNLWRWRLTLKPGETLTRTTFVTKVPQAWAPPEPWDPIWGPQPAPRFFYGATVNVRHTTVEFYLGVQPTYC